MAFGKYRTYRFINNKDPIIDKVRTLLQDEGLFAKGKRKIVHELSGVAIATLDGWFEGDTRKPITATIGAVVSCLGYEPKFVRRKKIDVEVELKRAADWLLRQHAEEPKASKRASTDRTLKHGSSQKAKSPQAQKNRHRIGKAYPSPSRRAENFASRAG